MKLTDGIRTVRVTAKELNSEGNWLECSEERVVEIVLGKDHPWPYSRMKDVYVGFYVDWHLQGISNKPGRILAVEELPVITAQELTDIF